uniref:Putative evasin n=1 Tax=Amblyomma americanum TaxID=6943 RepID=A0A0C9SCT8_AMBAM
MAFLWIFALAIVAVATADDNTVGAVPGCGEPAPPAKEREHGVVTDVNSCNRTILVTNGREVAASCMVHCPRNKSYPLRDLKRCLKFSTERFLQERKDGPP